MSTNTQEPIRRNRSRMFHLFVPPMLRTQYFVGMWNYAFHHGRYW